MPEDPAWWIWPIITRLVKTWCKINSLWLLAAIMAIINSCLLCCLGPPAPIVLKAEANMSIVQWALIPALQPIRATAAHLCGPVEHVSGYVQRWPCCCSHWKPVLWQYSAGWPHLWATMSIVSGPWDLCDLSSRSFAMSSLSELL